jgi:hypothetical protein
LSLVLEKHPELTELVRAWPSLSEDVRRTILHVARLSVKGSQGGKA